MGPKSPKSLKKVFSGLPARSVETVSKKSQRTRKSVKKVLKSVFGDFFDTVSTLRAGRSRKTFLRLFGDFGDRGCGDSCIWGLQSQFSLKNRHHHHRITNHWENFPYPPTLPFLEKKGNAEKNKGFPLRGTPKVLGKRRKNAQKKQGKLETKKARKSKKNKGWRVRECAPPSPNKKFIGKTLQASGKNFAGQW